MQMKRVFSSHISSIGYDPSTKELEVQFQNGNTAVYQDVPADIAKDVTDAPSVGTALNQFIKGAYSFGYKKNV